MSTTPTEQQIEAVLDVVAPWRTFGTETVRTPIFEWGGETTPTDAEMRELATRIVSAVLAL